MILGNPQKRKSYDQKLDTLAQGSGALGAGQTYGSAGAPQSTQPTGAVNPGAATLAQAKKYFASCNYEFAIQKCREAIRSRINRAEAYEVLCKSLFMRGDYEEAVRAADEGVKAFTSDKTLLWLSVRYRIQIERYQEAQQRINTIRQQHGVYSQLAAEQVYLYYFAGKDEQGKRFIDMFIKKHPSDQDFRKETAINLIDVSHQCYLYDQDADMLLITEKDAFDRALSLVTQANRLYQDAYTLKELETVRSYGRTDFDKTHSGVRNFYLIACILLIVRGIYLIWGKGMQNLLIEIRSQGLPAFVSGVFSANRTEYMECVSMLLIGILCFICFWLVRMVSMRPVWQIYRDECRGFHESEDRFLYNILSAPWEMVKALVWAFTG